jgi:hypothetical protein
MNATEKSAQKIKSLTGIAVSHSTQQRLVHRYHFEELPSNPEVAVEESEPTMAVRYD